jgi:DNA polymerase-1
MTKSLYVVDAHSLIFQVFHAIPEMSAPDGRPTNAVFGFTRDLLRLVDEKRADYVIAAFDTPKATFRDAMYPAYKATRSPMPDNLRPQIDMIRQVVSAMGVPLVECDGFEADDVIATVVAQAAGRDVATFICTGDKDARQLLGPRVSIYNLRKDLVFDAAALAADWGIRPDQVVDLLAMTGDSVDNVPGIDGVGPKTAATLLQEFGTLDNVLANVDRVSGKKRQENLRAGADTAHRARELVVLRSDVPIAVDWDAARAGQFDAPRLAQLFAEFGFRGLMNRFAATTPQPHPWVAQYRVVDSVDALAAVARELALETCVSISLLTTGGAAMQTRLVGLAFAVRAGAAWYVPVRGPLGSPLVDESSAVRLLRPVFEADRPAKHGHDLKHLAIVLRRLGVRLAGLAIDTMVADYLMEAGERSHNLDQLARRYLDHSIMSAESLLGKGPSQRTADLVGVADAARFAGEAADAIWRVAEVQEARLREQQLWQLYETLEGPLIEVLADMEFDGIAIDVSLLDRMSREFTADLARIEAKIFELAGGEFHIGSPTQLRQVLFERLGLPVLKRTKTGASTDQEVLEELAQRHPLPALLIEHRQIAKLKSTYVDALPRLVDPDTGRVHASFNQVVAATGRLSSSDPNLQNIPIRTEQGRQIRQAFVPRRLAARPAGGQANLFEPNGSDAPWQLLAADYSQIELRVLAHLSGDAELRRAFAEDQDIHNFVASQIYGVSPSEVTAEMRRGAKVVNFGVIYGLGPFGLAARLGISQDDAEAFIAAYFAKYRGVETFIGRVLDGAHRDGAVTTMLGRRRRIAGVRPRRGRQLNQPEREAVNTVVQGAAADLIKMAMLNLHRRIARERLRSRMLLQIHDELVLEVPADERAHLVEVVRCEMTGAIPLDVPLRVDVSIGPNWLDTEAVD